MIMRQIKNNMVYKFLLSLLIIIALTALTFIGCGGGFLGDNDNAGEFRNPIFHPEKVDTDTSGVR